MRLLPLFALLLLLCSACDTNSGALAGASDHPVDEKQLMRSRNADVYEPSSTDRSPSFRPGILPNDYARSENSAAHDTYLATAEEESRPNTDGPATDATFATPGGRWHGMRLIEE